MATKPITDDRVLQHLLVAWCPVDNWYVGEYKQPGQLCPGDFCARKLVSRRRWTCSICTDSFVKEGEAKAHDCDNIDW
jgi:hypothetical protein